MRHCLLSVLCALWLSGCPSSNSGGDRCDPSCGALEECVDGICRDATCNPPCREGRVCINGYCKRGCDPETGAGCGTSETCCEGILACVNLRTDFFNCGECGYGCPADRSSGCLDGRCACIGYSTSECEEGFGCCPNEGDSRSSTCVELLADPENCGECGHSCGGLQCVDGQCRCSSDEPCPADQECCADGCRNLQTDTLNCGACGTTCATGEDCCAGQCVNTLVDTAHCGACGLGCGGGEDCCLGECAATSSDPFNCGGRCVDGQCE